MKILWVKAGKILPLDTGGKIRSYNILHHLSARHELTFLSYYGGERDRDYEREITHELPGSMPLYTGAWDRTPLHRQLRYLRWLPSGLPFAVTKFTSPKVQSLVASWLSERRGDVAVCDFLSASLNFPRNPRTPTVLFQHNVESVLWQRQAEAEQNPLNRWIFQLEAARMKRYEREALQRFQHVIAVSEVDREQMKGMAPETPITVVPTGVDLGQFRPDPAVKSLPFLVMFVGSMDWTPNIDAVEWFCAEIWPRILAQVPQARFRIVGRAPDARVLKLACNTVEVTGTVASVVEHFRQAAVVAVPLRAGGGTRLKILEAMAVGKAVVSTTVGAEGLDVHPGRDILLADDQENFAQAVISLLQDPDLRGRYERCALELAARYDWSVIAERFVEVLDQAAGHAPTSGPALASVKA